MNFWIPFLALIACFAFVSGDIEDSRKRIKDALSHCKSELSPSEEDLQSLRNKQIPNSDNGKCFLGCVGTRLQLLKDGLYQRQLAQERIRSALEKSPDKMNKALEDLAKCDISITGTDKCQSGPQLFACLSTLNTIESPKW